jgi:tRNA U34 2-thiouridine synthase MnmA/TrmU
MSQQPKSEQKRAVALMSGGLDSLLAAKLILDQGIHVEGINFYTGFCVEGHTHAIRKKDRAKPKRNNALWSAEQLGMKLHIIDIIEEYKNVLINPKHGYGANMNPCLDCKIFMVSKARQWMEENDFDFIISGEVIGQRPMSQRKDLLPVVMHESGIDDRLLRPLCAKNLAATRPEREGWVHRDQLKDFSGLNRKPQMALAAEYGFVDYATPAGGCCFLTDKNYSKKLVDLWHARNKKDYELDDIMLLKVGRHLRPQPNYKLIISREEGENKFLQGYKKQYSTIEIKSHHGPLTLVDGELTDEDFKYASRIAARFSQGRQAERVTVKVTDKGGNEQTFDIPPMPASEIKQEWYI